MATATHKLTLEEFEEQYGHADRAYEFWDGDAIPKSRPTWIHGLLQAIIIQLFKEVGFRAAGEVELRIDQDKHPRPDVIATKNRNPIGQYPTEALDYVVEIVSEDDKLPHLKDKCRLYQAWGFGQVILVDPSDQTVMEWKNGAMIPISEFAGIPAARIWQELQRSTD